jgi:hypothetical protein
MDAAKQMIAEYLSGDVSDQEKAEAYTLIAELYLKTNNRINEEYLAGSEGLVEQLQELQTLENQTQDAIDLENTRKNLQS